MSMSGPIKVAMVCLAIVVAGSFLLARLDVAIPGLPADSNIPAKVTYPASPVEAGIAVSVVAPPDRVVFGDQAAMQLLLTNSTAAPVIVQLSWMAECFSFTPDQPLAIRVPAMTTTAQRIEVRPVCVSGSHPIALFGAVGGPKPAYQSVAAIAPIQIAAAWKVTAYRFFFLLAAFMRALVIPAALALLAYFLNRKADEIKQDQADRDARLKDEQDDRSRRASVLQLRMPEYFSMVQKHYLPISRRMDSIESEAPLLLAAVSGPLTPELRRRVDDLRTALTPPPVDSLAEQLQEELWKLLCAILLYRARFLSLAKSSGGIYFRSNQAERLFRDLVGGFFSAVYEHLGKEPFRLAVAFLDPEEELPSAMVKCKSGRLADADTLTEVHQRRQIFEDLWLALRDWIVKTPVEFRGYTRLVQLSSRILDFECDRPFYQTDPVDPPAAGDAAQASADPAATPAERKTGWYLDPPLLDFSPEMYDFPSGLWKSLDRELIWYIEHIPEDCKIGSAFPFPVRKPPRPTATAPVP